MKKKCVKITFFDAICLFIGRIVFWMLATIVFCCIAIWVIKGVCSLCIYLWPLILAHIGIYLSLLVCLFIAYIIWHYIRYDIQVLDIDGHRVVLRKKIFAFLYKTPTFGRYAMASKK